MKKIHSLQPLEAVVIYTTITDIPHALHSKVRLVNGHNRCEGRVEVLYDGSWGTVCDDDWDMVDANVVCRQLDCGLAMAVGTSSQFGQGSGAIVLDNMNCRGGEAELSECENQGWGVHNCYHYEDVAVICRGEASPLAEVDSEANRSFSQGCERERY